MSLAESLLKGEQSFLAVQIILIILILALAVRKFILYFGSRGPGDLPFHRSHHFILFLGVFGFAWGLFEQLVGLIQALDAIIEAADVSPEMILGGLKRSFLSPAIGFTTLLVSGIVWGVLHGKYSARLKSKDWQN